MDIRSLEQELKSLNKKLREETNFYTEAIAHKDYEKRKFFEEKINLLLQEIKFKTIVLEDLKNGN
jgi:hypothetical protein